ncbi:MAG: hypothetical protein IPG13_10630 [Rhodocyclaceae bacterium]|nr:hypothetical protein [Rhodocyclaceae bacterium]
MTSALLARWLIQPLIRLANATQRIGKGSAPRPYRKPGQPSLPRWRADSTEWAKVEALLANRTTLLAGISHDLRSPLARIRLALGMLTESPMPNCWSA